MTKAKPNAVATVKELLGDPKDRIKLDDFVIGLLKDTISVLSSDEFATSGVSVNADAFQGRLRRYEEATKDLLNASTMIARWGSPDQVASLARVVSRLAAINKNPTALAAWTSLRWYPLFLIMHAAGIASLFAGNFVALKPLLLTPLTNEMGGNSRHPVAYRVASDMHDIRDTFKSIPAHAKHLLPLSEYVFNYLRSPLDELLYLGDDYERHFDEFEILNALVYGDFHEAEHGRVWAAPGRFKFKFDHSGQPFDGFVVEATTAGSDWPLLTLGFFKSSAERFREVAKAYRELLTQLQWY